MKTVLRIWILVAAMLSGTLTPLTTRADSFSGEKTLGIRAGYNTWNERPLAGVEFSYRFNRLLRLAPAANYVFRHSGLDALQIDLNAEFVFPFAEGRFEAFPLAGMQFASWNYHQPANAWQTDDVSTRLNRLGLNLGGGMGFNVNGSMKLSLKWEASLIKDFSGHNITAGISYRF